MNNSSFYAPLSTRVYAAFIDGLIYLAVFVASSNFVESLAEPSTAIRIVILFGPVFLLEPIQLSAFGATIGYTIFGLYVRRKDLNQKLGFFRALLRFMGKSAFGILSLLFMLTTRRRQALHDLMADSVVCFRASAGTELEKTPSAEPVEATGYAYPSTTRRVVVVVVWNIVVLLVLGLCSAPTRNGERLISLLWLIFLAWSMDRGWRGQLPGCRRVKQNENGV